MPRTGGTIDTDLKIDMSVTAEKIDTDAMIATIDTDLKIDMSATFATIDTGATIEKIDTSLTIVTMLVATVRQIRIRCPNPRPSIRRPGWDETDVTSVKTPSADFGREACVSSAKSVVLLTLDDRDTPE